MWVNPLYSTSLKYHHSAVEVLQTNWHEPPSLSAPDLTYHIYIYILMYLHGFCWDKTSERISLHITPLYPSNGHSEPPTPVNPESYRNQRGFWHGWIKDNPCTKTHRTRIYICIDIHIYIYTCMLYILHYLFDEGRCFQVDLVAHASWQVSANLGWTCI